MLFLDGVGVGKRNPDVNPFLVAHLPALRSLCGGGIATLRNRRIEGTHSTLLPLDATFGVPGLPQSGTGQTALFTGINGPRLAGKHFGPFPYSTLKPVIREQNIFRRLLAAGKRPCFANAFPKQFFDYASHSGSRLTVTTLSCTSAGVPLLGAEDLRRGRAVSADITGAAWPDMGYPDITPVEPAEAGLRLVRLTEDSDFVLFEYWMTDKAGHARIQVNAIRVLEVFDAMLAGIMDGLNRETTLLLITSDHGNLEDLSTKSHTRNPVPLILSGYRQAEVAQLVQSTSRRSANLSAIAPILLRLIAPAP